MQYFHLTYSSKLQYNTPSHSSAPTAPVKYLLSIIGRLGGKFSDYTLVLCQKLHIRTYDRQNFSGDRPPVEDLYPPTGPFKWRCWNRPGYMQ